MQYITGNKFKAICHYTYDERGYIKQREPHGGDILKIFVNIDLIHSFFNIHQDRKYILITHNGDKPVDETCIKYLDDPNLITWYGQNICIHHPKVKSLPIGIANENWPHGNEDIFNEVASQNYTKDKLLYINFNIDTNKEERNFCLAELTKRGLRLEHNLPLKDYLIKVARSYFIISPNGNGIDCHKTWEALYLKTIPIITRSVNSSFYSKYPILIIDNWAEFDPSKLTINKYNQIWSNFNPESLDVHHFITN